MRELIIWDTGQTKMVRRQGRTPKLFSARIPYQPSGEMNISLSQLVSLLTVLAILGLLATFNRWPFLQISEVELVTSGNYQGDETTRAALTGQLQALKGKSILSRELERTKRSLIGEYLAIEELSCQRGLPRTVRCRASYREPWLVMKRSQAQYWVDRQGIIFAPQLDTQLILPLVEDRTQLDLPELGSQIIGDKLVGAILIASGKLKELNLTAEQFFIADTVYQFGAVIPYNPGPAPTKLTILLTSSYPLETQLTILQGLLKEKGSTITERVDLRVPGQVYFK